MPQITKLKAQKTRRRLNIYLDGKYITSLDLLTATKLGLRVGMTISQAKLEGLISAHQFEKLYERSLRFISYRPRSEKEVRTYLKRKWRAETTEIQLQKNIEKIIVKLKRRKLINDKEFTQWWINQRQEFRPKGKRLLKLELKQKGINSNLIEEALEKLNDFEAALSIASKKFNSLKRVQSDKAHKKLVSFLQRRGFNWEIIKRVVDELKLQE
jgi:regulatory protein